MIKAGRSLSGLCLFLMMSACASSGGSGSGNGGSNGSGGSSSTGGSSSGGSPGSGGSQTGGSPGSGGSSSGGSGSGGILGTGGSATGGSGQGGKPGTGGSGTGTGGSGTGTGGSGTGTGGSTNPSQPTVVTSGSGAYWTTGTLTASTGSATVTVNDTGTKQNWEGMGGAFNEIGWQQIQKLSASDQTTIIDMLFGADAAHFTMARIPIGASDYATTRYTEDETSGDTDLTSFSINQDKMYLIPYVKAALGVNPNLRLWASPWTPPTWMKTKSGSVNGNSCGNVVMNSKTDSSAFDGGCWNSANDTKTYTAYANYFVNFVKAYKDQSINIEAVAPQNEPNYAQGYPSCLWAPADLAKFVGQYLGPALGSTKVMLGTNSNGDANKDDSVITAIEGDAMAKTYPKMIGLQWSMLDNFEKSPSNYTKYNIPVWATEHKCGNYPWNPTGTGSSGCGLVSCPTYQTTAPNDQSYGVESWGYISSAIRAGVTAYNAWNMVLDGVGKGNDMVRDWAQDALITVMPSKCNGKTTGGICATPAYFVFRHISQFAQPGGTVLSTSGGDAVAFKNPDGSEAVAMYNSGSANSAYTVAIKGMKYSFSMPSGGWATVFVP
jgi:glucosylceramidase